MNQHRPVAALFFKTRVLVTQNSIPNIHFRKWLRNLWKTATNVWFLSQKSCHSSMSKPPSPSLSKEVVRWLHIRSTWTHFSWWHEVMGRYLIKVAKYSRSYFGTGVVSRSCEGLHLVHTCGWIHGTVRLLRQKMMEEEAMRWGSGAVSNLPITEWSVSSVAALRDIMRNANCCVINLSTTKYIEQKVKNSEEIGCPQVSYCSWMNAGWTQIARQLSYPQG